MSATSEIRGGVWLAALIPWLGVVCGGVAAVASIGVLSRGSAAACLGRSGSDG